MSRDIELHINAIRYVKRLLLECIELDRRLLRFDEPNSPLRSRLTDGIGKLSSIINFLERFEIEEVLIDPLQLARRYGFQGETQDGYHLANGMFAPWDAIKSMAYDRARLSDENNELRKKLINLQGKTNE